MLGNNRSGTSALTRVINLLGANLPGNLMPKTPDNPEGYWESYDFYKLNEELLKAAGTDWHDDAPIPENWFASDAVRVFHRQAQDLLNEFFHDTPLFVLKDPRMCRLVPFWQEALKEFSADISFILIVRHPHEVYSSFEARRKMSLPSIHSHEKSDLLWLRMILEAEYQTRGLNRSIVTYDALLSDWRSALQSMLATTGLSSRLSPIISSTIDNFLSTRHRHHYGKIKNSSANAELAVHIYNLFATHADEGTKLDVGRLDAVHYSLDHVEESFSSLRAPNRLVLHEQSPWHAEVLTQVAMHAKQDSMSSLRVLYISHHHETRSHMYRVKHHVAALNAGLVEASWVGLTEDALARIDEADVVVVFREIWNDLLMRCQARCRSLGIPFGFDIDDLIFNPEILTVQNFDFLRRWDEKQRQRWLQNHVGGYQRTLIESDFAVVSTKPLANAVQKFGIPAYVLSNGLDIEMIAQADAALIEFAQKPSTTDGMLRLGYASGTPTHQKDFATIVPVLCALMDDRPELILTLVGHLDLQEFPELQRHHERIETRSFVPHAELLREYARFDVNLAPLECGNPFCEAKSELKYYEAALVEVPTIAAATEPYRTAIKNSESGFSALTSNEWKAHLISLIDHPKERIRLGRNARVHAIATFGPEAQSVAACQIYNTIAREFSGRKPHIVVYRD